MYKRLTILLLLLLVLGTVAGAAHALTMTNLYTGQNSAMPALPGGASIMPFHLSGQYGDNSTKSYSATKELFLGSSHDNSVSKHFKWSNNAANNFMLHYDGAMATFQIGSKTMSYALDMGAGFGGLLFRLQAPAKTKVELGGLKLRDDEALNYDEIPNAPLIVNQLGKCDDQTQWWMLSNVGFAMDEGFDLMGTVKMAWGNTPFCGDGLRFDIYAIFDQAASVPEPATLLLMGAGMAGMALRRRLRS